MKEAEEEEDSETEGADVFESDDDNRSFDNNYDTMSDESGDEEEN